MKTLAFVFFCFFSSVALPDSISSSEETFSLSKKIMNQFAEEKFQLGIDMAKPYWPIEKIEADSLVNKIERQWPSILQGYGSFVGIEFLRSEYKGVFYERYFFLHKFKKGSIHWSFTFYKPEKEWILVALAYDDSDILWTH